MRISVLLLLMTIILITKGNNIPVRESNTLPVRKIMAVDEKIESGKDKNVKVNQDKADTLTHSSSFISITLYPAGR